MYRRILVALDRAKEECEGALVMANDLLGPGGEGILLHIIPPGVPITVGLFIVTANHVEEDERARTMRYLGPLADQLNQASARWRCEVAVSGSVAKGIVDFAVSENVDLIVMHTHDGKGLSKSLKGGVAETVQQRSPIEVRVLQPRELVAQ